MSAIESLARALLLVAAIAAALGCAGKPFPGRSLDFDYEPLPALETAPPPPADGAIWPGRTASGSFLFFDNKAQGRGDLVTVIIDEDISAEGSATTDLQGSSEMSTGLSSDVGLADLVSKIFREFVEFFGVDAPGGPAPGANLNVIQSTNDNNYEGEGSTERSGRFTANITCRVIGVLPGKIFHIQGRRSLLINAEEQLLTLEALVRQEDIGINNTVPSSVLAEARMRLDGIGVVDDKQRPGWAQRITDWIYPF